ncbi:hypothetical protein BDQ17DRAFT_1430286 [Cyathus striatus]|nr:hypothetical protein BDQ17DRAFT_1430286 [Cyathus striatus]
MDPNFSFPRPQAPIPRTRPLHPAATPNLEVNRESNALRASVLDAALQLGIGSNNLVAAWMFNNPVQEEEEEDQVSPSLTYGSSATSDESFRPYPGTPSTSTQSSNQPTYYPISRGVDTFNSIDALPSKLLEPENTDFATPTPDLTLKLPDAFNSWREELKKKRGDGYESDGGYMSESGKKKEKKEKKKKEKEEAERRDNGVDGGAEPSKEGQKKKKSFVTLRSSKKSEDKEADHATGYETDGALAFKKGGKSKTKKKSNTPSSDAGYGSDGGYLSSAPAVKKSKTRFFKIGSKSSKPDLRNYVERPDSVSSSDKDKDVLPLPIAERFATTLAQPMPTIPQSPPLFPTSSLPHRRPIPQDLVLPPVTIDSSAGPTFSSIPSPREHVAVRDSHISAVSATSTSTSTSSSGSHHKRKFFHFPGIRENGHGQSSESNSTFTSSLNVRSPSPSSSSPTSPSAKFPPISFPVTRATSPVPGLSTSPLPTSNSSQDLKRTADLSTLSPYALPPRSHTPSRAPSPSPSVGLTPNSPYVTYTPAGATSGLPTSPRPRNPPTDGFGPRAKLPPGGSPAVAPPSPHKPSQLTISPSDSLGPSPRNSILHSPNVLAYYDLPPPSPPPALPLPRIPQDSNAPGTVPRPLMPSRLSPAPPLPTTAGLNIQRGRVSPFPVSPRTTPRSSSPVGLGLSARPIPRRHEDFNNRRESVYIEHDDLSPRTPGIDVVEPSEDGNSFWEEEYDEEMNDVLQRFEDISSDDHEGERALESRRSFEAIRRNLASLGDVSQFEDDDDGRTVMRSSIESNSEDRNHRWSGSIYSRASFLDPDKSEETRQRFLKRVESMLNEEDRNGGGSAIPPVPKLPAGYAAAKVTSPGRSWNRF